MMLNLEALQKWEWNRPVSIGARVLIAEPKRRWESTDCFERPLADALTKTGWVLSFSRAPIIEQCKYRGQVVAIFDHPKRLEAGERRRACLVSVDQLGLLALDCSDDKRDTVRVLVAKGDIGKFRPINSVDMIRWRDTAFRTLQERYPHVQHPKDNSRCAGCVGKIEEVEYHTIPGQFIYVVKLKDKTDYNGNPIVLLAHPAEIYRPLETLEEDEQERMDAEKALDHVMSEDEQEGGVTSEMEDRSGTPTKGSKGGVGALRQHQKATSSSSYGGVTKDKREHVELHGYGAREVIERLHTEPHLLDKVNAAWYDASIKYKGIYAPHRQRVNFDSALDGGVQKKINDGDSIISRGLRK